ncbi:MAG: DUF2232 domain-containing protein [Candidatus Latescibacterota bacterium]
MLSGLFFALLMGGMDASGYLLNQLTIGPAEIPFIALAAFIARKYGWKTGIVYTVFGIIGTCSLLIPDLTLTPGVFLKTALTGIIIGEFGWFSGRFTWRLAAASLPGAIMALVVGLPLVINGASPDTLESIKQEALGMYKAFMSPDNAKNAADNALVMMRGVFKVGLSILILSSLVIAWLSFLFSNWTMQKVKEVPEQVPPLYTFTVPFHAIWIFLVSFGIVLSEYEPTFYIALNIFCVMAGLYCFQGLAIITHFMNRTSMGRIPRILLWLIFFITLAFSGVFLILIGVIDNWYKLRFVQSQSNTDGKEGKLQ